MRSTVAAVTLTLICAGLVLADRFPPDPVEQLRQELKAPEHPNLAQRVAALRSLADMRRGLGLQEWRSEVGGPDEPVFAALAERFKNEARRVLKNGTPDLRMAVMDMLAELGPTKGIAGALAPELAEQVRNGETPQIRALAARALGLVFPDPGVALPALLDLLASPSLPERRAAANALVDLLRVTNQLSSGPAGAQTREVPRGYIVQLGTAILPVASRGLENPDPQVRRLAAEATEQLAATLDNLVPQPRAGEELLLLPGESKEVGSAQRDLTPLLDAFSQQKAVFAKALQDSDVRVRLLIQHTLESLGNARLKLLHIGAANAPVAAPEPGPAPNAVPNDGQVAALTNQNQAPTDLLLPMLRDALPLLAEDVANPDVEVRRSAIDAIESFGSAASSAAPALIQALEDCDRFVRWSAGRTLGKMGPVQSAAAVPGLARLLFDPDLDVRLAACTALDRYGPAAKDAVPDLIRSIRASDADMRVAAMHTLTGIGTDAQPAVGALTTALSDPDQRVRQVAAEVLGRFGPLATSAAPALRAALDDPDADVRKAASEALLSVLPAEK